MTKIEKIKHGTGSSKWPFVVVRMPRGLFVKIKAMAKDATREGNGKVSRSVVVLRLLERGLYEATRSRATIKRHGRHRPKPAKARRPTKLAKKPTINGAQASVQ